MGYITGPKRGTRSGNFELLKTSSEYHKQLTVGGKNAGHFDQVTTGNITEPDTLLQ